MTAPNGEGFTLIGSVGTDHHPFPRFLEWVAAAQAELGCTALVQRGYTDMIDGARPDLDTVEFLAPDDLEAKMAAADVVVCHGGPGTMSLAMRCGHRPIVIARDPLQGEHVDDHQQRYTARLASEGSIDLPPTREAFIELVQHASSRPRTGGAASDEIGRAVQRFAELMADLESGRLPRRRWRDRLLVKRVP